MKKDFITLLTILALLSFNSYIGKAHAAEKQPSQKVSTKVKSNKAKSQGILPTTNVRTRTPHNYQGKPLPEVIRQGSYREENQHLPRSLAHDEYSRLLFIAVMQENIGAIKALLAKGADINAVDAKQGSSPLMYSVVYNKVRSLNYLILRGADLDVASLDGKTALHAAAIKKDATLINILLGSGANSDLADNQGMLALDYFAIQDLENNPHLIARFFYDDIDAALLYATKRDAPVATMYFLQRGADVNTRNEMGDSPLKHAIDNRNKAMVSLLLKAGASLQLYIAGRPVHAIDYARSTKDIELLLILDTVKIRRELEANIQSVKYQMPLVPQEPQQQPAEQYNNAKADSAKKLAPSTAPIINHKPAEAVKATTLPKLENPPVVKEKIVEPPKKAVYYRPGKAKPGVSKKEAAPISILPESINNQ